MAVVRVPLGAGTSFAEPVGPNRPKSPASANVVVKPCLALAHLHCVGLHRVVYMDPRHCGRHNRVFDEPRSVVDTVPGAVQVDIARHREKGFG